MKIYEIGGSVGSNGSTNWYWHYTATKREAEKHIAELKRDCEYVELNITQVAVDPGRAGIAAVLNYFIDRTCINEG